LGQSQDFLGREIRAGEPVITEFAIPIRLICNLWGKEQDLESLADYYDIEVPSVSLAVRYEDQWRLAA
jgi:uncharacterized protein (DUF433 family)